MLENDQIKPLARHASGHGHPAATGDNDNNETAINPHQEKVLQRKKFIKFSSFVAAIFLILAITIIILIFTIFKIKDPVINLNQITINQFNLANASTLLPTSSLGSNMSLVAQVSFKNPNYASFKYSNTTTTIYYRGTIIGEAKGPAGQATARRTMRTNVTVDVITSKFLSNPNFLSDVSSGLLPFNSYTRVGGRVKMLTFVERHIIVKMNCSMLVNVTSQKLQQQKCRRKVHL